MPPILAGQFTPHTRERVEPFYFSVAAIFETLSRAGVRAISRGYGEDIIAVASAWSLHLVRMNLSDLIGQFL
jgi:hypothetical protein